jgi:hypothetical protein
MTTTIVGRARKRWSINRKNILADFIAAFTMGVAAYEAVEAARKWLNEVKPSA